MYECMYVYVERVCFKHELGNNLCQWPSETSGEKLTKKLWEMKEKEVSEALLLLLLPLSLPLFPSPVPSLLLFATKLFTE
jgi:hypothetical protein